MFSYYQALSFLEKHQNLEGNTKYRYRKALKLSRVKKALEMLNHPEATFPSIHIAGTNGKGSTAIYLVTGLKANGYRVGLFTSPHIEDLRERIQINNQKISRKDFAYHTQILRKKISKDLKESLTYFEILTLIAFNYFASKKVDIAIIEVGLGGRLDATNVLTPLISVITSIAFDHEDKLGKTLSRIAQEKGGIIKLQGIVISVSQEPSARKKLQEIAKKRQAKIIFTSQKRSFQKKNVALAIKALEVLKRDFDFQLSLTKAEGQIRKTKLPGRLEEVSKKPRVFLDGAHNAAAIEGSIKILKMRFPKKKIFLLFGIARDKNLNRVTNVLSKASLPVVLTKSYYPRSAEPCDLRVLFGKKVKILDMERDPKKALRKCLSSLRFQDILLIIGSYYLVGDLRRYLLRRRNAKS